MSAQDKVNSTPLQISSVRPVINFNRCKAHGVCTHVCNQNVFMIKQITVEQFGELSFLGKLKALLNDNHKSFAVNPENCIGCGLCVDACGENAISLLPVDEKMA
jgi:4Fe-4S ferredoxin